MPSWCSYTSRVALLILTLTSVVACPSAPPLCPDQPTGEYIGSALVLEDGCTLTRGDVAPYDAVIDDENLPFPDGLEGCSAVFVGKIDGYSYDGEITLVTDQSWVFDGYVQGKHCRLRLLITAAQR